MSLPRLSIVVPSFNQCAYLPMTLDSILDQRYPDLELIVIDGKSTDKTSDVLAQYRSAIDVLVCEEDDGQTQAINKGLKLASGDYVTWLCSDDTLLRNALSTVASHIKTHPSTQWFGGWVQHIDADGAVLKLEKRTQAITLASTLLRSASQPFCFPQPGVWWNRNLHEQLGFLDERLHYCMDFEWWLRLLSAGLKPDVIDQPIATYRMHETSKTCAQPEGFIHEHVLVERAYARNLPIRDRWSVYRRTAYQHRAATLAQIGHRPWSQVIRHPWWLLSQQVRHQLWHGQPQAA
ncbi:glycosyltransferase family 2 protein [Mucisphaera sp.]|uniref:glycosyltransferase family 2 protein n=1 Tax=Mucisphaera sp. TaxID=2913024 RepID=UPI003D0A37B9